jgi:isoleucyl-tRNA synthetase
MNTSSYHSIILDKWEQEKMYKIYNVNRSDDNVPFRFMDGPPFCTGNLHMGHLSIGSIKSTVLNYKSMMGYSCNNKLGYD